MYYKTKYKTPDFVGNIRMHKRSYYLNVINLSTNSPSAVSFKSKNSL